MASVDELTDAHQNRLITAATAASNSGLATWRKVRLNDLDASWDDIEAQVVAPVVAAQARVVASADSYSSKLSKTYGFDAALSRIVPQAFVGVDGSGRDIGSLLHGSITTTKEAIGAGLGGIQSLEAGAAYLAAMMKTAIADIGRSSDLVSAAGKNYTRYARVVEPGACSRCIVLAGSTQFKPFKRHPACKCTVQPIPANEYMGNPRYSPNGVFDSMSRADQDRAFGKAGAQAIRDGADVGQVQSARRGARGMGYAYGEKSDTQWRRMRKTTIGYRPDGTPVQVYATSEGTTVRGRFGSQQRDRAETERLRGARYTSTKRVRLMPEEIMSIAGNDVDLRKAFLRDAGYLEYVPKNGYDRDNKWIAEIAVMRQEDRILVNRATLKFGNFTLG